MTGSAPSWRGVQAVHARWDEAYVVCVGKLGAPQAHGGGWYVLWGDPEEGGEQGTLVGRDAESLMGRDAGAQEGWDVGKDAGRDVGCPQWGGTRGIGAGWHVGCPGKDRDPGSRDEGPREGLGCQEGSHEG